MKAFLMYPDRDFDPGRDLPANEPDLSRDLELDVLLKAMADGDQFLFHVARQGLYSYLASPAEIVYRQHVLADCISQSGVVRDLYALAVAALAEEKQIHGFLFRDSPDTLMHRSRKAMELFAGKLHTLRDIGGTESATFRSEGFARFFAMLARELDDDYFAEMEAQLRELTFRHGMLISAGLGKGSKAVRYTLQRQPEQSWRDHLPGKRKPGYTFAVAALDEAGLKMLSELESQGLNGAANSLAQSVDHIRSFFRMLRAELGFYISCLNLRERLTAKEEPICFPVPASLAAGHADPASLSARGLYDVCLALSISSRAVGNDLDADGKRLIMITGANQGGKSTFLRSLGLAQLMTQAGMFVAAESFTASTSTGIFTHFKREEDATMEKGKLDEELARMSTIASHIRGGAFLLCNESFASTNEREGSEIARQILRAMIEAGIRAVYVTHMYDLAGGYYAEHDPGTLFLRAERQPDGHRTFRLLVREPLPTSFGEDVYREVFCTADQPAQT
jgi:MutS domain V